MVVIVAMLATLTCFAADGSWLKHVPDADRKRLNPFHGEDALGRGKRPSLRSERVQHATDGEIFWLLKNGNLAKGMPTWAALPEPMRWQIITFIKSLGPTEGQTEAEKQ